MERKKISEILYTPMTIKKVTFKTGDHGDYGVFEAEIDGNEISFTTGAGAIMGACFRYFAGLGIRIEQDVPLEFVEGWDCEFIEKTSSKGRVWVDYE